MGVLEEEVEKGDCDILVYPNERVLRVVIVSALRLINDSGQVLAQVAKVFQGTLLLRCTLPGTKQGVGEDPKEALDRMLDTKLLPIRNGVSIVKQTRDEEFRVSKKYGVNSKYLRTVFHAEFQQVNYAETPVVQRPATGSRLLRSNSTVSSTLESLNVFTLGEPSNAESISVFAWLEPDEYESLRRNWWFFTH